MGTEFDLLFTSSMEPYKSELKRFRQTHAVKTITSKGNQWTYFAGGKGDEVVLVLHGGGGPAESLFRYIMMFEEEYRVIAPTVPSSVDCVADVMDAILEILNKEKIAKVHIFGVSNGGMIGQCLVRKHPQMVSTLILFHSMLPSKDYARVFARRVKLFSIIPGRITNTLGRKWIIKQLRSDGKNAKPGEAAFWSAYFRELYGSEFMSKEHFVSRAKILTDYFQNYQFTPDDLIQWKGSVFIIESEKDQVVNQHERGRLKNFYAQAKTHTFTGRGHLGGGLFEAEKTVALINDFISHS
jgi:pimeloyl-ACP methyl ester carboxylesterase